MVAREWFVKHAPGWAETHAWDVIRRLERNIFPYIGPRPISEITASELLGVLRRIEGPGALETAHRGLRNVSAIFRFAAACGKAQRDPSGDLRGALPPVKHKHFAAVTEPKAIGAMLRAFDDCGWRIPPEIGPDKFMAGTNPLGGGSRERPI